MSHAELCLSLKRNSLSSFSFARLLFPKFRVTVEPILFLSPLERPAHVFVFSLCLFFLYACLAYLSVCGWNSSWVPASVRACLHQSTACSRWAHQEATTSCGDWGSLFAGLLNYAISKVLGLDTSVSLAHPPHNCAYRPSLDLPCPRVFGETTLVDITLVHLFTVKTLNMNTLNPTSCSTQGSWQCLKYSSFWNPQPNNHATFKVS